MISYSAMFWWLLFASSLQAICFLPDRYSTEKYAFDHPGYAPFISYLTFRKACDIVIDQFEYMFDPNTIQKGDIVYVNIWYLDWFVTCVHDFIQEPYILVTCDIGNWIPHPSLKKLLYDPKVAAWFGRNMMFSYHPKLFQIPMGPDVGLFDTHPDVFQPLINCLQTNNFTKKHFLYMNFLPREHGNRNKIVKLFEDKPYCYTRIHSGEPFVQLNREIFYDEIAASQFVLSPIGYETDCVRTWEALHLHSIPVIEHSFIDPLFDDMPVVKVFDWEEVNACYLEKNYEELKGKRLDKLDFSYWQDLIEEKKAMVLNDEIDFAYLDATQFGDLELKCLINLLEKIGARTVTYIGFLSAIRPYQLAKNAPFLEHIFLADRWLDIEIFNELPNFVKDRDLLSKKEKIILQSAPPQTLERPYKEALTTHPDSPVFVDLTYYRHSLVNDRDLGSFCSWQHCLKQDLLEMLEDLPKNGYLLGNQAQNEYVLKVLQKLKDVRIEGDLWYLRKGA